MNIGGVDARLPSPASHIGCRRPSDGERMDSQAENGPALLPCFSSLKLRPAPHEVPGFSMWTSDNFSFAMPKPAAASHGLSTFARSNQASQRQPVELPDANAVATANRLGPSAVQAASRGRESTHKKGMTLLNIGLRRTHPCPDKDQGG